MQRPIVKKISESDLVCDAIGTMTFKASADWINEELPEKFQIERQTVFNWVVERTKPNEETLRALVIAYPKTDARRQMAAKIQELRMREIQKEFAAHWISKATAA